MNQSINHSILYRHLYCILSEVTTIILFEREYIKLQQIFEGLLNVANKDIEQSFLKSPAL